ncbi:MAG TPA: protealysin inhibitor emfourin [Candidatus Eisenbacteria bacterium]|nr:protealysin inhibitor emfourin [Candidatus Eisenbacteria bacterium]
MRVEFRREGGIAAFPGLSRPFEVDGDSLPAAEADELNRLLGAARDAAPAAAEFMPAPDQPSWVITWDENGHARTLRVPDPAPDQRLQPLLDFARRKQRELRGA